MSTTTPEETVREFFKAYRDHDVDRMVTMCTDMAEFHYVPFEVWGKQRVVRGDGKVCTIGKVVWTGLIDAFPDLTNSVTAIHADGEGNVAAEVMIGGKQAGPWGTIDNPGATFDVPHLFLLHVDGEGLIDKVSAYWDCADQNRQLGRMEID